jgi:hypothetical protein
MDPTDAIHNLHLTIPCRSNFENGKHKARKACPSGPFGTLVHDTTE